MWKMSITTAGPKLVAARFSRPKWCKPQLWLGPRWARSWHCSHAARGAVARAWWRGALWRSVVRMGMGMGMGPHQRESRRDGGAANDALVFRAA
jgi:hypothetical protein